MIYSSSHCLISFEIDAQHTHIIDLVQGRSQHQSAWSDFNRTTFVTTFATSYFFIFSLYRRQVSSASKNTNPYKQNAADKATHFPKVLLYAYNSGILRHFIVVVVARGFFNISLRGQCPPRSANLPTRFFKLPHIFSL